MSARADRPDFDPAASGPGPAASDPGPGRAVSDPGPAASDPGPAAPTLPGLEAAPPAAAHDSPPIPGLEAGPVRAGSGAQRACEGPAAELSGGSSGAEPLGVKSRAGTERRAERERLGYPGLEAPAAPGGGREWVEYAWHVLTASGVLGSEPSAIRSQARVAALVYLCESFYDCDSSSSPEPPRYGDVSLDAFDVLDLEEELGFVEVPAPGGSAAPVQEGPADADEVDPIELEMRAEEEAEQMWPHCIEILLDEVLAPLMRLRGSTVLAAELWSLTIPLEDERLAYAHEGAGPGVEPTRFPLSQAMLDELLNHPSGELAMRHEWLIQR